MMTLTEKLKTRYPEHIAATHAQCADETVILRKDAAVAVLADLKHDPDLAFDFLMDLTAVDYLGREDLPRFEVVYHLYSLKHNHRLRIKVPVGEEDCEMDSVVSLWRAADWFEREVWDMFGIRFRNHPNLKRILMYEDFQGHPLRKDYPYNKRQPLIGSVN